MLMDMKSLLGSFSKDLFGGGFYGDYFRWYYFGSSNRGCQKMKALLRSEKEAAHSFKLYQVDQDDIRQKDHTVSEFVKKIRRTYVALGIQVFLTHFPASISFSKFWYWESDFLIFHAFIDSSWRHQWFIIFYSVRPKILNYLTFKVRKIVDGYYMGGKYHRSPA